jgi:hypothetical protein
MKARYILLGALAAAGAYGCDGLLGIVLLDGGAPDDAGLDGAGPGDGGPGDADADVSSVDAAVDAAGDASDASEGADGLDAAPEADGPAAEAGCYPRPSGLVSWWRAEGTADDFVGPNNGTLSNVTFVPGVVGQAFRFKGDGDVLANATGFPTGTSNRTVEMWVRLGKTYPNAAYVEGLFFGYGGFGAAGATYELLVVAGGSNQVPQDTLGFSQWGQLVPSTPPLTENAWHHVAAVLTSSTLTIYLDGLLAASETGEYPINTGAGGATYIGGSPTSKSPDPAWLTGDVDEVAVYTRALAPNEIQGIVDAGSAGKCP